VVHGRNEPLRKDLFAFLRSIGLQPLEWHKGIEATQVGSPSIKQILDAMFAQAAAVVVLLTPDDTARLKPEFQARNDPGYEKKFVGQARPNVLFEAGMAFGSHPDSVVLVQVGTVKPFTDIGGLHVTHLTNAPERRSELAQKLTNAGCDVETGSDWFSTGNFEIDE
jgi:predicted nucleotide-binding protein